jgi:hypothetical protein
MPPKPPQARKIGSQASGYADAALAHSAPQHLPSHRVSSQDMPPPPTPGPLQTVLQPAPVVVEKQRRRSKASFLTKTFPGPSASPVTKEVPAAPTVPDPLPVVPAPSTLEVSTKCMQFGV